MALLKEVTDDRGITFRYHRIGMVNMVYGGSLVVRIESWVSAESRTAGAAPSFLWDDHPIPEQFFNKEVPNRSELYGYVRASISPLFGAMSDED